MQKTLPCFGRWARRCLRPGRLPTVDRDALGQGAATASPSSGNEAQRSADPDAGDLLAVAGAAPSRLVGGPGISAARANQRDTATESAPPGARAPAPRGARCVRVLARLPHHGATSSGARGWGERRLGADARPGARHFGNRAGKAGEIAGFIPVDRAELEGGAVPTTWDQSRVAGVAGNSRAARTAQNVDGFRRRGRPAG